MTYAGPRVPERPEASTGSARHVRLNVAIQAHPKRAEMAAALAELLPGADVVFDPDPGGYPSPWRTYRLALERTPPSATHQLVLQEDVLLCDGFLPACLEACRQRPTDLLVLFHGGQPRDNLAALSSALYRDDPWACLNPQRWIPAVANIWPAPLIRPFLAWAYECEFPPQMRADDEIIGRGMRALGQRALAVVPSLAEHPDVVPSLLGRRAKAGLDRGRVAAHFTGQPPSGLRG